jgi:hypothetical protein
MANVRARTSDYIVMNLDEIGDHGLLPLDVDEPNSNIISTRKMMYLPLRYASLFLNPSGYTLRQSWEILYPALYSTS